MVPSKNGAIWNDVVNGKLITDDFKTKAIKWLSEAVQVKYVAFSYKIVYA